ncbi:MAG TPA: SusE domain-containing protein [Ferruginibacter sp.]|nr:SusE domain-containing protein [Ferruginibacter sp.]HMP20670.1 SusE domain-containing protein [Ferruginibacter sp.]
MKNIIQNILLCCVVSALFFACKKSENKIVFEGGKAPVLTANVTTSIPLSFLSETDEAITLSWTNPDYSFTTGVSSHDVAYILEIDTAGINFTGSKKKQVGFAGDLNKTFLQSEINDFLLNQLELAPGTTHSIDMRVVASISGSTPTSLASNVLTFTATPYSIPPKVAPPAAGTLYVTGSATPANWMGGGDPEVLAQKFTRVSETLYELTVNLNGGASYLLVPRYGNWSAVAPDPEKYGYTGANNANNVNGDDFRAYGGDILSPPESGNYKIVVDFQRGKFSVTRL